MVSLFGASLIPSIYKEAKENNHYSHLTLTAKPCSAAFSHRSCTVLKVHFIFCTILIQISRCGNVHCVPRKKLQIAPLL